MTMKHAERLLRKVKMNNNGTAEIHWKDFYVADDGARSYNDVDHKFPDGQERMVHEDFRKAFSVLNEHWLIRGEETGDPKASYPFDGSLKNIERVTVTSVTFSGGEPVDPNSGAERSSVAAHIQGTMTLKGGGVKNFCCPPIKLGAPQEKYKFVTHLDQHLQAIGSEVWQYVAGTKFAPPKEQQLAMNLTEGGGGEPGDDVNAIGGGDTPPAEQGSTRAEAMAAANSTPTSAERGAASDDDGDGPGDTPSPVIREDGEEG